MITTNQLIQKSKNLLLVFAVVFGLSLILLAPNAYASSHEESLFSGAKGEACAGTRLEGAPGGENCTADDAKRLGETIRSGIDLVSVVVGIIAVIMIIIGGIRFIVSDGDSGKVSTAKNTIMYALIGLILVAFAQTIVKFVLGRI
jgi:hypothetical protein